MNVKICFPREKYVVPVASEEEAKRLSLFVCSMYDSGKSSTLRFLLHDYKIFERPSKPE